MAKLIDCKNNSLTDEQIMSMLVGKTADGDWTLRTMIVGEAADNAINCNNNGMSFSEMWRNCIGIDPDTGKPALRIAPYPSFVNDGAAATGGLAVGDIYFNTTTERPHTRMA